MSTPFELDHEISWCPGCGNFGIRNALIQVLIELELSPEEVVIVSGIGQAGKLPHFVRTHMFNGLHGRALPVATAIKVVNPQLKVIAVGGDGDMYAEGAGHLIHAFRRNPDITVLVHNNMVYGLTKGQASPTSQRGFVASAQPEGVKEEPFNPLAVAILSGATFVARTFIGDFKLTVEIFKEAFVHKGLSFVDIFQPCVTFNRVNTYQWFRAHTARLPEGFPVQDKLTALEKALSEDPYYLGVFYRVQGTPTFEEEMRKGDLTPLWKKPPRTSEVFSFLESLR